VQRRITIGFFVSLLAVFSTLGPASPPLHAAGEPPAALPAAVTLEQKALQQGKIRIIVTLQVPQIKELTAAANQYRAPEGAKGAAPGVNPADAALGDAIARAAQGVLSALGGTEHQVNRIYRSIPAMALQVSAEALAVLRASTAVQAIVEDLPQKLIEPVPDGKGAKGEAPAAGDAGPAPPLLDVSAAKVGAPAAWSMGFTGAGQYVAILDTGIRSSHQFFQGKTILEACFALGSDEIGPAGDCPNGLTSQTGAGAAVHYDSSYAGYDHGTHVAGIAAGNNGTLFGVAKNASLIAVKVFSKFPGTDPGCGGSSSDPPCVLSWTSDQIAGLDYLYGIRGSYNIAAANMSLGGGKYASACDGDPTKPAIDNLRAAGIATAIATGNKGYCDGIGAPACVSSAVAVGSSTDSDGESPFNNWHPTLQELFAPGSAIYSSTGESDTSYDSWDGTSMATPHVAGAWALIKQAKPSVSVADAQAALEATGFLLVGLCGSLPPPIPRIQVDAAINSLLAGRGDINGDGVVTLADVIAALRITSGAGTGTLEGDANADGRLGIAEAIYGLQRVAGIR
jgi:subtilisin family serine protease